MSSGGALRVALVYDDSLDRPGGIPAYLASVARALSARGHHVEVLVGETRQAELAGCPVHSLARNLHVRFNGNRLSIPARPRRSEIRRLAARGSFDVVHVQVPYSPLMAGQLLGALPAGCAVVGTFHVASERMLPRLGARLLSRACAPTLARFDEIACVSYHAAGFAAETFGLADARIVTNMVDLAWWQDEPLSEGNGPLIAFVGALVPRKGPEILLEAFARVHGQRPGARLVMAGAGPLASRLQRRAARLGLSDAVTLTGAISEQDKRRLLRRAQLACFPSRFGESCGVVLLEAMAAGTPLLAGDCPGYAETLHAASGSLCPPVAELLAERVVELLDDEPQRAQLRREQRRVVEAYRHDAVVEDVLALYRRARARRGGRAPARLPLAA
jgi:phosphatidylinositol alpha-mannosyltransferase